MFVSARDVLDYISDAGGLGAVQVLDESRYLHEGLAAGVVGAPMSARIRVRLAGWANNDEIYSIWEGVQGDGVDAVGIEG
jgi:hypothetical protein